MRQCPGRARRSGFLPVVPGVLSVLVVVAACGSEGGSQAATADQVTGTRDSAGVTIVDNAGPAWGSRTPWAVATEPEVVIGSAGGSEEYRLDGVQNAVRLKGGAIVVADGRSNRIRIYDGTGVHLRDIGGSGDGPGEFRMLGGVGRIRGDSLAAWDARSRRITVFDREGRPGVVTTVKDVTGFVVQDRGWFADGSALITPGISVAGMRNAMPGERREPVAYLLATRTGTVDTLAVLPGREEVVHRSGNTVSASPILFGHDSHAFAADDALYAGRSDRPEVQVWSADGHLQRIVRWAATPRAVTSADRKWVREQARAARERRRALSAMAGGPPVDQKDEAPPPSRDTHPYFDRIMVDAEGVLWVRTYRGYGAAQEWLVFDRGGSWLGTVSTPADLEVTDIGADYVMGIARDDLDVEQVRLYRILGRETREQTRVP